jgi:hypothetical protein
VAAAGALLNVVCDALLFSGAASGQDLASPERAFALAGRTPAVLSATATALGALCIASWSYARRPLESLLFAAGARLARACGFFFALFVGACVAQHVAFGYRSVLARLAGDGRVDPEVALTVLGPLQVALDAATVLPLAACSGLYVLAVARGRSGLPRWAAASSPIVAAALPPWIASLAPAPWGGAVWMVSSTAGLAAFFLFVAACAPAREG